MKKKKGLIKLAKRYSLAYNTHMAYCWANWLFQPARQYAVDYDWEFVDYE